MWIASQSALTGVAALLAPAAFLLKLGPGNGATISPEDKREVAYLMLATLAALVTLLMFILGIFIMKRMGARLRSQRVGGEPTTYVDTWSQYRLSEDEIAAATDEGDSPPAGGEPWDDENDTPDGETR